MYRIYNFIIPIFAIFIVWNSIKSDVSQINIAIFLMLFCIWTNTSKV
jgi:hypothetical protein